MASLPASNLKVYPMRLLPGAEIKTSLIEFVKKNKLKAAFVMSCCGSVQSAKLRFATPTPGSRRQSLTPTPVLTETVQSYKENFEICSLVGTLGQDGAHLHTTLGRANGSTLSGHVVGEMKVQTTAEIVLGECLTEVFTWKFDESTGYDELVVTKR